MGKNDVKVLRKRSQKNEAFTMVLNKYYGVHPRRIIHSSEWLDGRHSCTKVWSSTIRIRSDKVAWTSSVRDVVNWWIRPHKNSIGFAAATVFFLSFFPFGLCCKSLSVFFLLWGGSVGGRYWYGSGRESWNEKKMLEQLFALLLLLFWAQYSNNITHMHTLSQFRNARTMLKLL